MKQPDEQPTQQDETFERGTRAHVTSTDPLVQYVTRWRLSTAIAKLAREAGGRLSASSPFLLMCAGEGLEGTVLCDLGYLDVTVSDISSTGVTLAQARDGRLKGLVLNAEDAAIHDNAFDVVLVQDGLHHLLRPVLGFTEMLRIARVGALFLEPHDSIIGNMLGTKWERNGDAINYVFRWRRSLVEDVASSYLGRNSFRNLSFSFWHHNIALHRLGRALGGGATAIKVIDMTKRLADGALGRWGNQFCGLVLKG